MTRVNLNTIHFLGSDVLRAKKQKYLHNPSMGTGDAQVAISWPKAMAMTTRTVNPCRLAHPCRSLSVYCNADSCRVILISSIVCNSSIRRPSSQGA
jgi:hypothetical protein